MGTEASKMSSSSQIFPGQLPPAMVHNLNVVEHYNQPKEREVRDLRVIRKVLGEMSYLKVIEVLRKEVYGGGPMENREAYLRSKLREIFPKLLSMVVKRLSPGLQIQCSSKLSEIVEVCIQIVGGFNSKWFFDSSHHTLVNTFRKDPVKSHLKTFHKFPQLPPEIRVMIWNLAVRAQDRRVTTYRLRRVLRAPCPTLFLVCKESKFWAMKKYKKVRNGDLLYGKILPAYFEARGPIISFDDDIVGIGDWFAWNPNRGSRCYTSEILGRQAGGLGLRKIHQRIKALSKVGFRRVIVGDKYTSLYPEMLFYKNSRKVHTTYRNFGGIRDDWSWNWTDKLEEVWKLERIYNMVDHTSKESFVRLYPPAPGDECSCSLCERADLNMGIKDIPYKKPDPYDIEEHERIFDMVKPYSHWDGTGTHGPTALRCLQWFDS
ncbi:hypothetical protein K445DRAFT_300754 [Daldinia sp. EC12]|nr:hypothetical protein K445DRAFT_300754 [Daldinia sp. EC12]